MAAQLEKDLLEKKHARQIGRDGLSGNACNAKKQLTTFKIDADRDVLMMERERDNTKDKLKDIERRIKQQESRARELDQTRAVQERRLHALTGSVDTL